MRNDFGLLTKRDVRSSARGEVQIINFNGFKFKVPEIMSAWDIITKLNISENDVEYIKNGIILSIIKVPPSLHIFEMIKLAETDYEDKDFYDKMHRIEKFYKM